MVRKRTQLRKSSFGKLHVERLEDRLCPSSYSLPIDLGQNPDTQASINDSGQVAHTVHIRDARYVLGRNFAERYPAPVIFDTLGGQFDRAYGINSLGDVVGAAETIPEDQWREKHVGSLSSHAFLFQDFGSMKDLRTLAPGDVIHYSNDYFHGDVPAESGALAVNDQDQVVGWSDTGFFTTEAFLWTPGGTDGEPSNPEMTRLGTFGGSFSEATAINNNGQVVGIADTLFDRSEFAFIYGAANGMQLLDGVGGTWSEARGISDRGQVVGGYSGGGFIWSNGTVTNLGSNSYAWGINNLGQVVGESGGHAFLYSNGTVVDLNSLIPANSGWTLRTALGINDSGQIVGVGVGPSSYDVDPRTGRVVFDMPSTFLLNPTGATHFQIAAPASTTAGDSLSITVTAQDIANNPVVDYTGTVHFTSSDLHVVLPPDYTFTSDDHGVHSFQVTLKTVKNPDDPQHQHIIVTDAADSSITGEDRVEVRPAPTFQFVLQAPPTHIAGNNLNVTVAPQDEFGNVTTDYTGTVAFTSSDPQAVLPLDYTFTNDDAQSGSHIFNVTLKTVNRDNNHLQNITVTDTTDASITGIKNVEVKPAAASNFDVFLDKLTAKTAGTPFVFHVIALDTFSNQATDYTGTVAFTSSDHQAELPDNFTFPSDNQKSQSFQAILKIVKNPENGNTQNITVTDTTNPAISGHVPVEMKPDMASKFNVVLRYDTPKTAGTPFQFDVVAVDQFDNQATDYAGAVAFTSSDSLAEVQGGRTFTSDDQGSKLFSAILKTVNETGDHSQTIVVTDMGDSSITGTAAIELHAAPASRFEVNAFPPVITAGDDLDCDATALDPFGNIVRDYSGTLQFSSSDPQAGFFGFTAGDPGTFSFLAKLKTVKNPETGDIGQRITVNDMINESIRGETKVTILPAAANHFGVVAPSHTTAGAPFDVDVSALDPFGNVDANYSGGVTVEIPDGNSTLTGIVSITSGVGGFQTTPFTAGQHTITVTDTANNFGTAEVNIKAARVVSFGVFLGDPQTAGIPFQAGLIGFDQFGNTSDDYAGIVHFRSYFDPQANLPDDVAPSFHGADEPVPYLFQATFSTGGYEDITVTDTAEPSIYGYSFTHVWAPTVSLANAVDGQPVTLSAGPGTLLANVAGVANSSPQNAPSGIVFPVGFFNFIVHGLVPGGSATVTITLPSGVLVSDYYKYGPTPDNPSPHWYNFRFDGLTGAEIHLNVITLHFRDGQRGDDDLSINGTIVDPGAPAALANHPPTVTVPSAQVANEDVDLAIGGIRVGDVDNGSVRVTLSVGHGTLMLGTTAGLTIGGNGTGALTLYGSLANLNAALASLVYGGNLNFGGDDMLRITASDGSLNTAAGVAIHVKSAAEQAAALQAQVNALRDAGVLNKGRANSLIVKLNLKGNNGDIGKVNSFLDEVNALLDAGILTEAQANALLGSGTILLTSVKRR